MNPGPAAFLAASLEGLRPLLKGSPRFLTALRALLREDFHERGFNFFAWDNGERAACPMNPISQAAAREDVKL